MLFSAYISLSSKWRHNGKLKFPNVNVKKYSTHRREYISFYSQDSDFLVSLTFNYAGMN